MRRSETLILEAKRKEQERIDKSCCPTYTAGCIECGKTECYKFHCKYPGYTCNIIFSHALFWPLAFLAVFNYGYSDGYGSMQTAGVEQMSIISGRAGQGVFPI